MGGVPSQYSDEHLQATDALNIQQLSRVLMQFYSAELVELPPAHSHQLGESFFGLVYDNQLLYFYSEELHEYFTGVCNLLAPNQQLVSYFFRSCSADRHLDDPDRTHFKVIVELLKYLHNFDIQLDEVSADVLADTIHFGCPLNNLEAVVPTTIAEQARHVELQFLWIVYAYLNAELPIEVRHSLSFDCVSCITGEEASVPTPLLLQHTRIFAEANGLPVDVPLVRVDLWWGPDEDIDPDAVMEAEQF